MQRLPIYCLFLIVCAAPAYAGDGGYTMLLSRTEKYLNSLSTIEANFVQITPEGDVASGKFYLKRPGKMRWQYDPPVPVLMVSSGEKIIYYDYELDQVNRIALEDTLAGFLALDHIRFSADTLKVLEAKQSDGVIRIRVTQRQKPDEGELTLELSDQPMQLRNLIIRDAEGRDTNVSFGNARYGLELDNDLFVFKKPGGGRSNYRK